MRSPFSADERRSPAPGLARWQLRDLEHAARVARAAGACAVTLHGVKLTFLAEDGLQQPAEAGAAGGAEGAPMAARAESASTSKSRSTRQRRSNDRLLEFRKRKEQQAAALCNCLQVSNAL